MLELRLPLPSSQPLRILCLGAHSDDIEIGCGGTILQLCGRYEHVEVNWIVFSATLSRADEARRSAEAFLLEAAHKNVTLFEFQDGYFPTQAANIKDQFERLKKLEPPDLVFTHYREDRHQDHRVISDLTWNTFRSHLILEYEIPKYDGDMGHPNVFVSLNEATCHAKVAKLLSCFPTQLEKPWFDKETFLALMRLRGMEANADSRYAEAFYGRKLTFT